MSGLKHKGKRAQQIIALQKEAGLLNMLPTTFVSRRGSIYLSGLEISAGVSAASKKLNTKVLHQNW